MHRGRHMVTHWGSRINVSGVRRSYPPPTKKDAVTSQQKERGKGRRDDERQHERDGLADREC